MRKFSVITLIHNQENNLDRILMSYDSQLFQPCEYVFVLDRCTDKSKEIILDFIRTHRGICVENNAGDGFMAGYCRNLGLLNIENPELVLFLDGDCVLSSNILFKTAYDELNSKSNTIVLFSRVFEKQNSHEIESLDRRISVPWFKDRVFVDGINHVVTDTFVARWKALVISCAFGVDIEFIDLVSNINNKLNYPGVLFPTIYDGNWGGEDEYLGWIAMLFNVNVIAINPRINVIHIWHESHYSPKNESTANTAYEALVEFALDENAPGIDNILIDLNNEVFETIIKITKSKRVSFADPKNTEMVRSYL